MRIKTILVFFGLLLTLFLAGTRSASAFGCGERNVIGATPPYWGTNASQNVVLGKGAVTQISIRGEDGCATQTAEFQIKKGASLVKTINVVMQKGAAVTGQTGAYILFGNWTIDLDAGSYSVQLTKIANLPEYQSNLSSNTLEVQVNQACNLSKVYASPNGGKPGDKVQLVVEGQGSCLNWGATIIVQDASRNGVVFTGSQQKFTQGSNRLSWGWTLPSLSVGTEQAVFYIEASLGQQKLKSPNFVVSSSGTSEDSGDTGDTTSTGGDQTFTFQIPNPLSGSADSLLDLVNVITTWIFNISIPIAVIFILWAGFLMLTAGDKPANFAKGKKVLTYVVIGLAIIFIGKGFITLIQSVLELGGASTTTDSGLPTTGGKCGSNGKCSDGRACDADQDCLPGKGVGGVCSTDSNCKAGLICENTMCQHSSGNFLNGPCLSDANCSIGLTCVASGEQIDGREIGRCKDSITEPGGDIGTYCSSSSQCSSGLTCNIICQRPGGNREGEACYSNGFTATGCMSGLTCLADRGGGLGTCTQRTTPPPTPTTGAGGDIGASCLKNSCKQSLQCSSGKMCTRTGGNLQGELCYSNTDCDLRYHCDLDNNLLGKQDGKQLGFCVP